ncbi:MAG: hypothetical protein H0U49_07605 [Parachlamydiaceae bacterium]|nr:hypothetical protein [Parachlamydiaceae bacterium]
MIKLTLTPKTQPVSYVFEKNRIAIGSTLLDTFKIPSDPGNVSKPLHAEKNSNPRSKAKKFPTEENSKVISHQPDLPLPLPNLLPEHVTIEEIDDKYLAINVSNDPFTTLNGAPFRKKFLSNGDIIEIQSISIEFEALRTLATPIPQRINPNVDDLLRRVEELEASLREASGLNPLPKDHSQLPETDNHSFDLNPQNPNLRRKSLKDDYLRDLDEENEGDPIKNPNATPRFVISWTALFSFIVGLLFFCGAAFSIFYYSMIERSEREEIKVAAAVADVVMALNFAQINQALPQNQNWSDPDFLKHNLTAVLANRYKPLANIDSHGQFHGTSYILRIYTSNDLAHFLVIAQPNASLLQTLVPKSAIIVDSNIMELRKTKDLKTLNRLLIDPTLDSSNSGEIAYLVGKGELITFEQLNRSQKDGSFSNPKALAFIRPGAENLIYNALRYYHFGETLTKNAVSLYETRDNQHDVSHMMQQIEALMKFKNIVLYTTGGLQTAIAAQIALAAFAPQHKFLFGYLQLRSGVASSGHLLIDDASAVAALNPSETPKNDSFGSFKRLDAHGNKEKSHPLDYLIPELSLERHNALMAIDENLSELINSENAAPHPDFTRNCTLLLEKYELTDLKYQTWIAETLGLLSIATLNDEVPL